MPINKIIYNIHNLCNQHQLIIATCESFTVGKIASQLASLPGSSKIFAGSIIAYQSLTKHHLLKLDPNIQIISLECGQQMAISCAKSFPNADIILTTTGNAGPTNFDNQPLGKGFIVIYFPKLAKTMNLEITMHGKNRHSLTNDGCKQALVFLWKTLTLFPNF